MSRMYAILEPEFDDLSGTESMARGLIGIFGALTPDDIYGTYQNPLTVDHRPSAPHVVVHIYMCGRKASINNSFIEQYSRDVHEVFQGAAG